MTNRSILKAVFITCAIFCGHDIYAQSGWRPVNPFPTRENLNAADYFKTYSAPNVIVGDLGTIIISGYPWIYPASGTRRNLRGVALRGANLGIIVGDSGTVLQTADGGETWAVSQLDASLDFNNVAFRDDKEAFIIGDDGKIFSSPDSGATWVERESGTGSSLYGIYFLDEFYGFIVGAGGVILRTTDGGATWQMQESGVNLTLRDVSFTSTDTGIVVGSIGTILRTRDGGASWHKFEIGMGVNLNALYLSSGSYAIIVGESGIRLETGPGDSWNLIQSGTEETLNDANGYGVIVGNNGTVITGYNTLTSSDITKKNLESVAFYGDEDGLIVGAEGTILKSQNGGATWTAVDGGITDSLYSVQMPGEETFYAAGSGGAIIKTVNAGATWARLLENAGEYAGVSFRDVFFINADTGYAAGSGGVILKSTDAGNTWERLLPAGNPYSNHVFYALYFHTADTGYAAGSGELLLKTADGGATWNPARPDLNGSAATGRDFRDIEFSDSDTGLAVGEEGVIYRTSDGGGDWMQIPIQGNPSLLGISAATPGVWTAVGENGVIYRSADAGDSWEEQTSWTNQDLKGIYAIDRNHAVAIGNAGFILRTSTAGSQTKSPPNALFTVTPPRGLTDSVFIVNASGSTDKEDDAAKLRARWDWNNDGSWDTDFRVEKIDSIMFDKPGMYTIRLEVEDSDGMTAQYTRTILVGLYIIKTIQNDTATIVANLAYTDISLKFISGNVAGKSINFIEYGPNIKGFPLFEGQSFTKAIGYYSLTGLDNFSAEMSYSYIDSQATMAEINENDLELAYFSYGEWHAMSTTVDTTKNLVSTVIDHLSIWAITDKNEGYIVGIEDENPVSEFKTYQLKQNYPNPFNPETRISYSILSSSHVTVTIYNILGQEVKKLVNTFQPSGSYEARWDGKDNFNRPVSSGIYLYRLETAEYVQTKKMLLLR